METTTHTSLDNTLEASQDWPNHFVKKKIMVSCVIFGSLFLNFKIYIEIRTHINKTQNYQQIRVSILLVEVFFLVFQIFQTSN